jgi:shikimate kinase
MASPIVLLGPLQSGKTTVGKLLSDQLGLPLVHFATIARQYRKEIGYDEADAREAWAQGFWEGFYRYMQPFEAHAIERALPGLSDCILELDSRQAVFEDPGLLRRVQAALQPCPNVILLLPSPDLEEALRLIEKRQDFNEHFVRHPSNRELAKLVVYTHGKTPEETCEEILSRVDPRAPEIILIGPMSAGKSTQGKLLAERLNLPQVPMDERRWDYYAEIGWSKEEQQRIQEAEGFAGVTRYWKPFEVHAVGRLLAEHQNCVIDFGAGHSVYEDDAQFARVRELLAPYPNVVLLLPSSDLDESVAILRERRQVRIGGMELNRFFCTHMLKLAKQVVATEGKSPEETARQIIAGLAEVSHELYFAAQMEEAEQVMREVRDVLKKLAE